MMEALVCLVFTSILLFIVEVLILLLSGLYWIDGILGRMVRGFLLIGGILLSMSVRFASMIRCKYLSILMSLKIRIFDMGPSP